MVLRQLMYDKYGEDRFALACEIVSRWLKFDLKDKSYTMEWVDKMANRPVNAFDYPIEQALRRLFGDKERKSAKK